MGFPGAFFTVGAAATVLPVSLMGAGAGVCADTVAARPHNTAETKTDLMFNMGILTRQATVA